MVMLVPTVLERIRVRCQPRFGSELSVTVRDGTHHLIESRKVWVSVIMVPLIRVLLSVTIRNGRIVCSVFSRHVVADVQAELAEAGMEPVIEESYTET